ncbi:MAG TPA: hypothetical protein VKB76_11310 [Ktedonobacterales bacterium]|nr:hypothetical protein [Ktedonobacterales bacterium]
MSLTKKERARRTVLIHELSHLSRDGWANACRAMWEPLERELRELNIKGGYEAPPKPRSEHD